MSHPTANKIYIYKTGEKFPPLKYDPDTNPDTIVAFLGRRADGSKELRKTLKPTSVGVQH